MKDDKEEDRKVSCDAIPSPLRIVLGLTLSITEAGSGHQGQANGKGRTRALCQAGGEDEQEATRPIEEEREAQQADQLLIGAALAICKNNYKILRAREDSRVANSKRQSHQSMMAPMPLSLATICHITISESRLGVWRERNHSIDICIRWRSGCCRQLFSPHRYLSLQVNPNSLNIIDVYYHNNVHIIPRMLHHETDSKRGGTKMNCSPPKNQQILYETNDATTVDHD